MREGGRRGGEGGGANCRRREHVRARARARACLKTARGEARLPKSMVVNLLSLSSEGSLIVTSPTCKSAVLPLPSASTISVEGAPPAGAAGRSRAVGSTRNMKSEVRKPPRKAVPQRQMTSTSSSYLGVRDVKYGGRATGGDQRSLDGGEPGLQMTYPVPIKCIASTRMRYTAQPISAPEAKPDKTPCVVGETCPGTIFSPISAVGTGTGEGAGAGMDMGDDVGLCLDVGVVLSERAHGRTWGEGAHPRARAHI